MHINNEINSVNMVDFNVEVDMKKILLSVLSIIIICSMLVYTVRASDTSQDVSQEDGETTATVTDALPQTQTIGKYDEKKGIASIRLMYCADTGARDIIKSGYAFFIGDESNVYLISCCDTVILTDEEKNAVAASHGVTGDKVNTVIELVLKDDVTVELSIVNSSESMDFAILQPAAKISSCTTIRLCTETNKTKKGDTVRTYDENMQQIDCIIDDWSEINDAHYYMYSSDHSVAKGLPLLNEDGEVIGIISSANKGNPEEYFALQIDEVIEVLDLLEIAYNPEIVVDTTVLDEQIAVYEELEEKKYTEESWKNCQSSYENAKSLLERVASGEVTSYTQDEVNAAAADLNEKIATLKKAGVSVKTMIIIAIVEGVVLLVVIVILTVLLIVKTNKYKKQIKEKDNQTIMAKEALKISGRVTPGFIPNNTNMPVNRSLNEAGNNQQPDNAGETSVLGTEMNYQSVYSDSGMSSYPTIVRYRTGESVMIRQNSFIIGSSMDSVDYYISGNSNISRKHACIMKFEDGYYIQDLDTTNGTYVNDMRVMPGKYMKVENGNIIKLAEEEFEFRG